MWNFCFNRKLGDGLFLQCCREVASGYPDITFDSMIVDNTTMQVTDDDILGNPGNVLLLILFVLLNSICVV